jgi:protein-tyrosine-phosphatase
MARKDVRAVLLAGVVSIECKGNSCRSPMFAELFRRAAKKAGLAVEIISAGCMASAANGNPAAPEWAKLIDETGVDMSSHRSQGINQLDLSKVGAHLCVDPEASELVGQIPGVNQDTIFLAEIPNPYDVQGDGRLDAYRDTFARACDTIDFILEQPTGFTAEAAREHRA